MKQLTICLLLIVAIGSAKAQAPAYIHDQQNKLMNIASSDETRHLYTWVDTNNVIHSKVFFIGQKLIENRNVWTIYDICDKGIWMSCKSNNGDSYCAFEYAISLKSPKTKKK